jgi:hypothetical protein
MKLKNCPFCGSVPEVQSSPATTRYPGKVFWITCSCGIETPVRPTGITKFWNTRAPDSSAERLAEALRGVLPWVMRDNTPCGCPAGADEQTPNERAIMPTTHSTACQDARAALAEYERTKG